MTACSSNSLFMALDMFRNVPIDCDICDNWASWCWTICSCCRICCWRSSCVDAAFACDGDPDVANRLYLVFFMTLLGTKLLCEVGLDNDTASDAVWKKEFKSLRRHGISVVANAMTNLRGPRESLSIFILLTRTLFHLRDFFFGLCNKMLSSG